MSLPEEDLDAKLLRLARETEPLGPSPGFRDRVLYAVEADAARGVSPDVLRAARRLLPVALLAAALGVFWAVESVHSVDEALATSDDVIEPVW
jgi:hypothetical protein